MYRNNPLGRGRGFRALSGPVSIACALRTKRNTGEPGPSGTEGWSGCLTNTTETNWVPGPGDLDGHCGTPGVALHNTQHFHRVH